MTTTPEAQRELAGADLSEALHEQLLAPFLDMPQAGPALTAAARPGCDLVLQLDLKNGAWFALQAGRVLAAQQLDSEAHREVGEAAMHALTTALNAEAASRREAMAEGIGDAMPFAALRITATSNTTVIGMADKTGRVLFSAQRAVECSPQQALKPLPVH